MAPAIGDYALIGDCRSAALVSREGAIDWLCWPRFDSVPLFGRIIDSRRGGFWGIRPSGRFTSRRRYLGSSPVVLTEFLTDGGKFTLTDFMPVAAQAEKHRLLLPEHEIVRLARCERGKVEIEFDFSPGYFAGRQGAPRAGKNGIRFPFQNGVCTLLAEFPLRTKGLSARATAVLSAGQAACSSISFDSLAPGVIPPLKGEEALERTIRWWEDWAGQCRWKGKYRETVIRSAVTLKLMGFSPSGTFIAAPTTSLPENPGGSLNWDYRYCWLRDSSLTLRALVSLGYRTEARAYLSWLLHSTRLTLPRLGVMYDVFGRSPAAESSLPFGGYAGSVPVRTGNAARSQLQLDVYGEVVDAAFGMISSEPRLDRETRMLMEQFGKFVCGHWDEPDSGIWEIRGERKRFTHSLVLCWACLDRLIGLYRAGLLPGVPVEMFGRERSRIGAVVMEKAWNTSMNSYVSTLGGDEVDANLLLLPFYGFLPSGDARMRSTYETIVRRLGAGPGLLYRNRDNNEGAFAVCSCWAAEYLARGGGSLEEARELFETFLGYSNDIGLFAEEIDPGTGTALGNFPLAFTHLGVINAALSLQAREEREKAVEPGGSEWKGAR